MVDRDRGAERDLAPAPDAALDLAPAPDFAVVHDATPQDAAPARDGALDAVVDAALDLDPAGACRLWLGFSAGAAVEDGAAAWGACPGVEADRAGALPCASSRGTGRFYSFAVGDAPGQGDALGVALTCGGPAGAWLQAHCRVTVAVGKPSDIAQWDRRGCAGCVDTGGDGRFHRHVLAGPLAGLGIAFSCEDAELPDRAAAVTGTVAAWISSQQRREGAEGCQDEPLFDDSEVWGACPGSVVDSEGRHRCAASPVDGSFAAFSLEDLTLGPCSGLGVALRPRE